MRRQNPQDLKLKDEINSIKNKISDVEEQLKEEQRVIYLKLNFSRFGL
jgi:septal ring factor EnvC (AmiA/AmiB activator)